MASPAFQSLLQTYLIPMCAVRAGAQYDLTPFDV